MQKKKLWRIKFFLSLVVGEKNFRVKIMRFFFFNQFLLHVFYVEYKKPPLPKPFSSFSINLKICWDFSFKFSEGWLQWDLSGAQLQQKRKKKCKKHKKENLFFIVYPPVIVFGWYRFELALYLNQSTLWVRGVQVFSDTPIGLISIYVYYNNKKKYYWTEFDLIGE